MLNQRNHRQGPFIMRACWLANGTKEKQSNPDRIVHRHWFYVFLVIVLFCYESFLITSPFPSAYYYRRITTKTKKKQKLPNSNASYTK